MNWAVPWLASRLRWKSQIVPHPVRIQILEALAKGLKCKNIFATGVAVATAPPAPTGMPKTGFMTVTMVRAEALTIVSDTTGRSAAAEKSIDVICPVLLGNTAAFMKAAPCYHQDRSLLSGKESGFSGERLFSKDIFCGKWGTD